MTQKYAFFGPIGIGKTYCANLVKDIYGADNVEILSFATGLKDLAKEILGRDIDKSIDRLLISNLGQGIKSPVLKFMGSEYLSSYIFTSALKSGSIGDENNYKFHHRMVNSLHRFIKNNPWGSESVWSDLLIKKVKESSRPIVVIDDLRFNIEHRDLAANGFRFIRLECDHNIRVQRIIDRDGQYNPSYDELDSEKEWPNMKYDSIVYTSKDIEKQLKEIICLNGEINTSP